MDASRDGIARILDGNPPEVAQAEGKWPRRQDRGIMEVIAVFIQVFAETVVVLPAEDLEEFGARFGDVDPPLRLVVAQALARRAVVRAKISVGFDRGAIDVE